MSVFQNKQNEMDGMALISIFNQFSIILIALLCFIHAQGSSSYRKMNLKNVCQLDFDNNEIELYQDSAPIIIEDDEYFSSFSGRYEYRCKFLIKVKEREFHEGGGIYAVIQDLNFRKKENGECLDYIKFSVPKTTLKFFDLGHKNPRKFCGDLSPGLWLPGGYYTPKENKYKNNEDLSPNGYRAPGNLLAVEIFMARERLSPGQRLIINIVITPYGQKCFTGKYENNVVLCKSDDNYECILNDYVNDNFQNCPYYSCYDERGCLEWRKDKDVKSTKGISSGFGAKVTYGAVAAIVLILLKFLLCLWLCKRITRRRRQQVQRVAGPRSRPEPVHPPPTAPPLDKQESIDMPPSYESLFPSGQPDAISQSDNRV